MFDFKKFLKDENNWTIKTFGPGICTERIIDHIKKELKEIEQNPNDPEEWVDVILLALDGLHRLIRYKGECLDINLEDSMIFAMISKQKTNFNRTWPDWQKVDSDKAITHLNIENKDFKQ